MFSRTVGHMFDVKTGYTHADSNRTVIVTFLILKITDCIMNI